MSTETNTTIPDYQDAYDKAQQYIKLALEIVKGLSGADNKFVNGGVYSKDKAGFEGENIIPKKR